MIEVASAPCISCISCSTLVAMFTTWFRRSLDVAFLQVPHCDFNTSLSRSTDFCTEGFSLLPLLQGDTRDWHHAAFSQYQRGTRKGFARPAHCTTAYVIICMHACLSPCVHALAGNIMGYTMRMDTLRYTEWVTFDYTSNQANFSDVRTDPLTPCCVTRLACVHAGDSSRAVHLRPAYTPWL